MQKGPTVNPQRLGGKLMWALSFPAVAGVLWLLFAASFGLPLRVGDEAFFVAVFLALGCLVFLLPSRFRRVVFGHGVGNTR